MKGVTFTGSRGCEVVERPVAEPGCGEVRVRVEATGICGSDLSVYRAEAAGDQIRGHEPAGVVEAVGPGVRRLRVGDRVSAHHHIGCGACAACARGETVACPDDRVVGVAVPGSFAESLVVPERNCVPLPPSLSFVDGAFMGCVGSTAFAALRRLEATAGDSLAVFGLGPVGLSCVLVAKAMGLRVAGVDVLAHRLELALACGAEVAVDGAQADVPAELQAFATIAGWNGPAGVDLAIETSGSEPARRALLPSLRRGGRIAVVGVGSNAEVICPSAIHGKAATLVGSVVWPLGWGWELARFMAVTGLSFAPAVTHRFALDDAPAALRVADQAAGGKVLFVPTHDA